MSGAHRHGRPAFALDRDRDLHEHITSLRVDVTSVAFAGSIFLGFDSLVLNGIDNPIRFFDLLIPMDWRSPDWRPV